MGLGTFSKLNGLLIIYFMKQHVLTLYMTIPWMVDEPPSIEVFREMLARTRDVHEVNSEWYFIWWNWVYWKIELVNR